MILSYDQAYRTRLYLIENAWVSIGCVGVEWFKSNVKVSRLSETMIISFWRLLLVKWFHVTQLKMTVLFGLIYRWKWINLAKVDGHTVNVPKTQNQMNQSRADYHHSTCGRHHPTSCKNIYCYKSRQKKVQSWTNESFNWPNHKPRSLHYGTHYLEQIWIRHWLKL